MENGKIHLMKCIFNIAILIGLFGCIPSSSRKDEKSNLYNEILNQIINDTYCHYCSTPNDFIKNKYKKLIDAKIDTTTYFKILDSLNSVSGQSKKCLLEYSEDLRIFYMDNSKVDSSMKVSIESDLEEDSFIAEYFGSTKALTITDTLSLKAFLTASDLSGNCVEITPYVRDSDDPFKNGIGVLGFSKIYLNQKNNKAVVYYEFMCGRSCGRGELVILKKGLIKWKVMKYIRIWTS